MLTLTAAAYLALPLLDSLTLRWFSRDLTLRGAVVTTTMSESLSTALQWGGNERIQTLFAHAVKDERLLALGLCRPSGELLRHSAAFPPDVSCAQAQAIAQQDVPSLALAGGRVHVSMHQVRQDGVHLANLVLLQDLSLVDWRSKDTQKYLIAFMAVLGVMIAIITVIVAQLSWRG